MPSSVLKKFYGYTTFRPGQKEIIDNTLEGRDSVVLMPTGGGKSLCYQIPALMLPGCAVVVSPLIALMVDQVQALNANGIPAAAVHSNQDERINQELLYKASAGQIKLLYISPERLMADFSNIVAKIPLSLVAIDEAHCISQWGHDFRPVYTQLKAIKGALPKVPVMALTATADRLTRQDIAQALGLGNPFSWIGSFDRPNLSLTVLQNHDKKQRLRIITRFIEKYSHDQGIVYCLSRKNTEAMNEALLKMGCKSVCYHAGMVAGQRAAAQKAFVNGDVQVVCATIAFGMGIDKSNIRWVVHNNIPGNIESYYQEIGRAGRDGLPAETILFYNYGDIITRRSFVDQSAQREVNSEKLDFMQRYAESSVCRRRILLSYFSEESTHDCGNCDNCRQPRPKIDGTILAQKALSAVIRINSAESMNIVVDILRGSNRSDIIQRGYNRIKTYGAGADLSSQEWHSYLLQMIQLGVFEIAYEDHMHLRPTPYGMKVLKGLENIELSRYVAPRFDLGKKGKENKKAEVKLTPEEKLLETLKEIRKEVAAKENLAPYMVFGDATLLDMVKKLPDTLEALLQVHGIGELKAVRFGKQFLGALRKYKHGSAKIPVGTSQKESLLLFNSGRNPEEIAQIKGVAVQTIYGHLLAFHNEGTEVDLKRLVTPAQAALVKKTMNSNPEEAYQILEGQHGIPGYIVRAAIALLNSTK